MPAAQLTGWVNLDAWCLAKGLSPLQRSWVGTNLVLQVGNGQGVWRINVGSRIVFWNGTQCWLGFAPGLINGAPVVHALDAEKVLLPPLKPARVLPRQGRTIVLDPGHGGTDRGTQAGDSRRTEKELTLDWANRLKPLLESNGWRVFLTRTQDAGISLTNRVAVAEQHRADLFLSLHFNAAAPPQSGIETYRLTPVGMPSNLTRGFEDDLNVTHPNNGFDAENLQLALNLHRALVHATDAPDRGVRHARFMTVLRGQNRPAVLIEGGYLSNPHEARLIATSAYRQKLAEAIAASLE
jgi:N-acetylmuramoyl-L-alanine amidase